MDQKHLHDDDWDNKKRSSKGGLFHAVQVGVGSAVTRKSYSLAPCSHLFHTECLEKWLAIKVCSLMGHAPDILMVARTYALNVEDRCLRCEERTSYGT